VSLLKIVKGESFYILEFLLILFIFSVVIVSPLIYFIAHFCLGMDVNVSVQLITITLIAPISLMTIWTLVFDRPIKIKISFKRNFFKERRSPSY
jgi:hypothetical protein